MQVFHQTSSSLLLFLLLKLSLLFFHYDFINESTRLRAICLVDLKRGKNMVLIKTRNANMIWLVGSHTFIPLILPLTLTILFHIMPIQKNHNFTFSFRDARRRNHTYSGFCMSTENQHENSSRKLSRVQLTSRLCIACFNI